MKKFIEENWLKIIVIVVVVVGIAYFSPSKNTPVDVKKEVDSTAQSKIDINAACEGALAYMTFPDGASADAFVVECKEGKYPDVIERYKKDLGIDATVK
mgnify:CR=1 FL=1